MILSRFKMKKMTESKKETVIFIFIRFYPQ